MTSPKVPNDGNNPISEEEDSTRVMEENEADPGQETVVELPPERPEPGPRPRPEKKRKISLGTWIAGCVVLAGLCLVVSLGAVFAYTLLAPSPPEWAVWVAPTLTPTYTPTATSTPTYTPTITPTYTLTSTHTLTPTYTLTPTPMPFLFTMADFSESWLPDVSQIPSGMHLFGSYDFWNEDIAEGDEEYLEFLNEIGRIYGYGEWYLNDDGCDSIGLRDFFVEVVLYDNLEGPTRAMERNLSIHPGKETFSYAEGATIEFVETEDDCNPPGLLRGFRMQFKRHNLLGVVSVFAVTGSMTDNELMYLALDLADIIDGRIQEDMP